MSTAASLIPLSVLDDDAWDDLLSFIEERRVMPIIGPDLLMVATDAGPRGCREPARRAALRREAATLMDGTPAEYQNLFTTRLWRGRIAQAQRGQYPWTGRGRN